MISDISNISNLRPIEVFKRYTKREVEPVVERQIVDERRADSYHIAALLRTNSVCPEKFIDVYA